MNERIEELIDRATVPVIETNDYNGMAYETYQFSQELFAELIVKECMTMCDETRADYLKHRKAAADFIDKNLYAEGEAASDTIKYKMKKHFGVKE
jgi:hypothetical protein